MEAASLPNLNARQLRAVLAIAEYRSFIAAAAYLKVSQPALTRTIKQVERALGVGLFVRTTRQVEITPAGREFAAVAERLLNDLRISVENVRKHQPAQAGQIIVSSVLALADAIPPALLVAFARRYPGIEIHLREGIQSDIVDEVRGGVAIAFTGREAAIIGDAAHVADRGVDELRALFGAHPRGDAIVMI